MRWDQAGFPPKGDQQEVPEQSRLFPFPPSCPAFNPIENLWDLGKSRVANTVWETLEAIEGARAEVLEPFWTSVERVGALLGDHWLTQGVAAFLKQRESLISNSKWYYL